MTTVTQPQTFQDQLKTLSQILEKLKTVLPDEERKGERYHSFECSTISGEQEKVTNTINTIKTTYDQFSKVQNTSNIIKHVTERLQLTTFNQPIQDCLQNVKIKMRKLASGNSLESTIQRLESLCTEEGLRFDKDKTIFISCDMFYIEIALDSNGMAEDVNIHFTHTGEGKTLKELVNILRKKDFDEFHAHLKGLKQRYLMLKGDRFQKSKVLNALDILEQDIVKIMQSDPMSSNIADNISMGPVGYITPTMGGNNLTLTYFADPLELLDTKMPGQNKELSQNNLAQDFGFSVGVGVEPHQDSLLQTASIVNVDMGNVAYTPLDKTNSERLAASFVLQFNKPLPVSLLTAKLLQKLTRPDTPFFHESYASLDDLIIEQKFGMNRDDWGKKEFFVELPNEVHAYRCVPSKEKDNIGVMLHKIPFTQASQIPQIIKILRCQAMYNTLVCSFFRGSKNELNDDADDERKTLVFDTQAFEGNVLTVNFIHPLDETLGSIDILVTTDAIIECHLNVLPGSPIICSNDYLNKIANRCLSVPLLLRSLMKKSKTCRPEVVAPSMTTPSKKTSPHKVFQKPLKLVMPTIAQIQSNHPIISPQLTNSPSAFLNFSATGLSGPPIFPSSAQPADNKRKRTTSSTITTPTTPMSDGSRTPSTKLKIKIKRKKTDASETYEIDKTRTEMEAAEGQSHAAISATQILMSQDSIDSLAFGLPSNPGDATLLRSNSVFSDGVTFPELAGIPLDSDADLDNLLGIPSEPFVQSDTNSSSMGGNAQPAAFDIDAIRPPGSEMNFDTLPTNAIDPTLVTSSAFDIDPNNIDDIVMDSLI
ncbi:mediator of RNA polymerase II transcription subunit 1-like [Clytia hemisphaerica]|uniref:Mediator of RNA polymerase II transcription subunit 1 n=1 Tax=Clytia hemisphaerica TaxID=252671 RepID=A0A7M5VC10_9CNID